MSVDTKGVAFEVIDIRPRCANTPCWRKGAFLVRVIGPLLQPIRVCRSHVEWAKARLVEQDDES